MSRGAGRRGGCSRGTRGLLEQADHRRVPAAWPLRSHHTCRGGGQSLGTEGSPALSPRPRCHKGEAARPAVRRERWTSGPGVKLHWVGRRSQVGTDPEIGPCRGHLPWSKQGGADFPWPLLGGKVKPRQAAELFELPTPSSSPVSQHSRLQLATPAASFTRGLGACSAGRPQGALAQSPLRGQQPPRQVPRPTSACTGAAGDTLLRTAGLASTRVGTETITSIPR